MRRHLLILSLLCVLTACHRGFTPPAGSPVARYGQLQVLGTQLCDADSTPVVLRGISIGWHNLWPRFYNAGAVHELATEWHATVIRAAMGIGIEDNYLENPEFALQCMTPVIEAALREGVYVIVDWHSHWYHPEEAAAFFGWVAERYGQYPNIIYELYNEPVDDTWEDLTTYCRTVAAAIRQYDADNIILMGCPHWDQYIDLPAAAPIEGIDNLMYTVHFYAGTHRQELRDRTAAAIEAGVPVFISECAAVDASGDGDLDMENWAEWVTFMQEHQLSWIHWSISDKNESCSMLLPRAKADGGWTPDLIKPWGKIVKQTLTEYNL